MQKLRETSLLIWYLFIIEQMLFVIGLLIWVVIEHGWNWLEILSALSSSLAVFIIRVTLTIIPLILMYIVVLRDIRLQRLIFLATLNVTANAIVMWVLSLTLFSNLFNTPLGQSTLVITFISPFVLSIVPLFKEIIQEATGIGLGVFD